VAHVLIVEDDPAIAGLVRLYLAHAGYSVEIVRDGVLGLRRFETAATEIDLLVLVLRLPGLDGRGLGRRIRAGAGERPDVPILMLTALDDDRDKIDGLELGADDYVTKPFNPDELVARVRALLRRAPPPTAAISPDAIALGPARLDLAARRLTVGSEEVVLRTKEFDLLAALAAHPGIVLDRETLLARVWDAAYSGDTRTVDVHVSRLRDKLIAARTGIRIETVRSIGYRLVVPER